MTYRQLLEMMQYMNDAELDSRVVVYEELYDYHYPVSGFEVTADTSGNPLPIIILE